MHCSISPKVSECERKIYSDQSSPLISFQGAWLRGSKLIWHTPQLGRRVCGLNDGSHTINDFMGPEFHRLRITRPRFGVSLENCEAIVSESFGEHTYSMRALIHCTLNILPWVCSWQCKSSATILRARTIFKFSCFVSKLMWHPICSAWPLPSMEATNRD